MKEKKLLKLMYVVDRYLFSSKLWASQMLRVLGTIQPFLKKQS